MVQWLTLALGSCDSKNGTNTSDDLCEDSTYTLLALQGKLQDEHEGSGHNMNHANMSTNMNMPKCHKHQFVVLLEESRIHEGYCDINERQECIPEERERNTSMQRGTWVGHAMITRTYLVHSHAFLAVFTSPLVAIFLHFPESPAILKFYNSPSTTMIHNPPVVGEG